MRLFTKIFIVLILSVGKAWATDPLTIEVQQRDGYARLILVTPEQADFSARLNDALLEISFEEAVTGDLEKPTAQAGDVFKAAHHRNETNVLRFTVPDGLRLHTSQSFNVIAVDLLLPGYTGTPKNIISHRELGRDRMTEFFADKSPSVRSGKTKKRLEPELHLSSVQPVVLPLPDWLISSTAGEMQAFLAPVNLDFIKKKTNEKGFEETESRLLSAIADGRGNVENTVEIASKFYFANGLFPEAFALVEQFTTPTRDAKLIAAIAQYNTGRYSDVVKALSHPDLITVSLARAWRGLANAQLGAYKNAARDLFPLDREINAVLGNEIAFANVHIAFAEGDLDRARQFLESVPLETLSGSERENALFLRHRFDALAGNFDEAVAGFSALSMSGAPSVASAAAVERAYARFLAGDLTSEAAIADIRGILTVRRGGSFERRSQFLIATILDRTNNIEARFDAWRLVFDNYPDADISGKAEATLRSLVLSYSEHDLPPMTAARLFYQNIEFAPPGREGDRLIVDVANELVELDLLAEAAELLDHQVFYRSRGERRAVLALQLAEVYLQADKYKDALDVIENTRRSRLPENIQADRALLEARVLVELEQPDEALAVIKDFDVIDADILRGDVAAARRNWPQAAGYYEKAITTLMDHSDVILPSAKQLIVKTAIAALRSDQRGTLTGLIDRLKNRNSDEHAVALLGAIRSLIDSEPGFIDFVDAYDGYFTDPV